MGCGASKNTKADEPGKPKDPPPKTPESRPSSASSSSSSEAPPPPVRPPPVVGGPPVDEGAVPYGEWGSVITADDIAASSVSLKTTVVANGTTYWLESRPSEAGRYVIVRENSKGKAVDVIPSPWSARSIVYNYGGGPFAVSESGTVYFANYTPPKDGDDDDEGDYRIYQMSSKADKPTPLTTTKNMRYGNLVYDGKNKVIWAVREDWNGVYEPLLPTVSIVRIKCKTGEETVQISGKDMYFCGEVNADGSAFSYITWNYPNMPWDGTKLYVAQLNKKGHVNNSIFISGGSNMSIMEPRWGLDKRLYYISDSNGRWNFKKAKVSTSSVSIESVTNLTDAEFGAPQWGMGSKMFAFDTQSKNIIAARCKQGSFSLVQVETKEPYHVTELDLTDEHGRGFTSLSAISGGSDSVVFIGGNNWTPSAVIEYTPSSGKHKTLRASHTLKANVDKYISTAEAIEFPTTDGATAYGFFYPPTNPKYTGPHGEKPPLIIRSHGGPSGAASTGLDLNIHYFTSRGLALVDVNYRGSSGYGRDFLTSLYGYWGVKDPQDCLAAADYLEKRGDIDGKRLVAEGGSAGGYCTNVLATYYDRLAAGASFYGISNLLQLAKMTGNYERHYIDQLVGPLPQSTDLYKERSPLYHVQKKGVKLTVPVVFFQGTDDHVVPPDQTKAIYETLVKKKIPTAEMLFQGEQHGFRMEKNIKASLWGEEYFLGQMLGYTPHDRSLPKIDIKNWPQK